MAPPLMSTPVRRSRPRSSKALLTVLVAAGLVAAACGGDSGGTGDAAESGDGSPGEGATPLTLMTWGDVQFQQANYDVLAEVDPDEAAKYELEISLGGANDTESAQQFRLMLSAGQGVPDIVQMNYTAVPEFAEAGVLSDVQPLLGDSVDSVSSAAQQLMQYDGTYVAVPFEVKQKLWFYRKDLFEQAGIDITEVTDLDGLIAAGKALEAEVPGTRVWNIGAAPQQYNLMQILSGNGAEFLDSRAPGCEFVVASDPGVRQAFEALRELNDSGVVADVSDFTPDWEQALADGTIASSLIGSWFATFLPDYGPDDAGNWGVTTWPEIGGAVGGSEGAGSVFVIPADAEHPQEAAAYLEALYLGTETSLAMWEASALYPRTDEALGDPAFTAGESYFGEELPAAFAAAGEDYSIFPYDPASVREITILNQALIEYLAAPEPDLDGTLQQAQDNLQQQIGCPFE